jgi:hypothetical protein
MTSRREFVQGSLALSTLAMLSPRGAFAAARVDGTAVAASIVTIADRTFSASAEFAREAERHGLRVHGFDGDVGGLWLHVVEPKIATGRAAIVGLTGAGVLFCLETLARAHGFGAVFRAVRPAASAHAWPKVAASYSLAAAVAAARAGGETLAPFEHHFESAAAHDRLLGAAAPELGASAAERDFSTNPAEPRLLAWTLAHAVRRPAPLPT